MSRDIWITSDHHFSHANILKFTDDVGQLIRPEFSSVEEMDEVMIERWNSVVNPHDLVWHLGDIMFNKTKFVENILPKLNGKLRITVGNHDDIRFLASLNRFEKIVMERRFDEFGLILSHRPLHQSGLWNHRGQFELHNCFGHIHQNPAPDGPYTNVCVERTNYTPVNIEELRR
jgi:calcineurin-like phosphoesterase family protein